jgi:hypothetical protein
MYIHTYIYAYISICKGVQGGIEADKGEAGLE